MGRKRSMALACIFFFCVLSVSACKKHVGTEEDNAAAQEASEESLPFGTTKRIGFSMIDMKNPYFLTLEKAAKEVLDKEGYELVSKDADTNPQLQAAQIKEMIENGIDAIILTPVDWEEITPSLQELKEAGVRIINVDTQVKEMEYIDAYIGSDNYHAGFICGEDLIEKCPDGGKIAILECPTQNSVNDRITGFEEALASAENGFEVVARADTAGEFERGLEACTQILRENPDVSAIMCGNDQIAVAAITAVNVANLKNVVIYGVDGSPDIKKELQKTDTQVAGTAAQSPIRIGQKAAGTALAVLHKEDYEREDYEEVFMINKDNVEMYGADGWQ